MPTKTKDFIRRYISAVWQLELLLLFKNSRTGMTIQEASRALYIESRELETCALALMKAGILAKQGESFSYAPSNSALQDAIEQTASMYNERRTAVISFIYESPIQSFADAFLFKQEEDE